MDKTRGVKETMLSLKESAKTEQILFSDYETTVKEIVLAKREQVSLDAKSSGTAGVFVIVRGYGWLRTTNTSIEMKPGRVLDISAYVGKGREYFIEATSESMELLRLDATYHAG